MVLLRRSTITIDQVTDAVAVFQGLFAHEDKIDQDKEHFYVMHLDSRRHISLVELVAIGVLTDVKIHPRETFRRAVIAGTDSIIVAHNHPSGDVIPSENDVKVTLVCLRLAKCYRFPYLITLSLRKPATSAFGIIKHDLPCRNRSGKEVNKYL
jgi:DNA repair protein RadC